MPVGAKTVELFVDGKRVDFTKVKLVYTEKDVTDINGKRMPTGKLEITLTHDSRVQKAFTGRKWVREESEPHASELDRMQSWH